MARTGSSQRQDLGIQPRFPMWVPVTNLNLQSLHWQEAGIMSQSHKLNPVIPLQDVDILNTDQTPVLLVLLKDITININ